MTCRVDIIETFLSDDVFQLKGRKQIVTCRVNIIETFLSDDVFQWKKRKQIVTYRVNVIETVDVLGKDESKQRGQ